MGFKVRQVGEYMWCHQGGPGFSLNNKLGEYQPNYKTFSMPRSLSSSFSQANFQILTQGAFIQRSSIQAETESKTKWLFFLLINSVHFLNATQAFVASPTNLSLSTFGFLTIMRFQNLDLIDGGLREISSNVKWMFL